MKRNHFEGKIVRVLDRSGRSFTGLATLFLPEYGLHVFDRNEESVKLNDYQLFESDIMEKEL